jgi:hypothetical protein
MGGAVPPLPLYAFMAWCSVRGSTGTTLPFTFFIILNVEPQYVDQGQNGQGSRIDRSTTTRTPVLGTTRCRIILPPRIKVAAYNMRLLASTYFKALHDAVLRPNDKRTLHYVSQP